MSIKRQPGESRAEFIQRLVATRPPLSEAQRARLRPILAPLREGAARADLCDPPAALG